MDRRSFLPTLAGGLLSATSRPKTNFVFILADDLGARDIGCYGNPNVSTPNLDRLASQGAKFTNAYAACPVCSPTRASILTGRYPVHTGVTDWITGRPSAPRGPIITPRTATELALREQTIAECLKPLGYRSASIGKWHLGGAGFSPTEQGFDLNIAGTHSGSPPPSRSPYFGPANLPGLSLGENDFLTEKLTQSATTFIEQNKANPFFLYLSHFTVHIPLGARQEAIARHSAKSAGRYNPTYAAMIESLDDSVGAVMQTLQSNGLDDRTMLVFFSDNGGLRYESTSQSAVTDNAPFRAGKGHLYEGGIREPLLLRCPGLVKPGTVIDTPVSSVDFLPTFADLAGTSPAGVDGLSLRPLLQGRRLKSRPLYWHYPHYSNQGGEPGSAIREGDWKLIEFLTDHRRELYNLRQDPAEKSNLISRHPAQAKALWSKLDRWRATTGAIFPQPNPNRDPNWPGWNLTGAEPPTPPSPVNQR
jgi:arylsulfatase A-like enzyme